MRWNQKFGDVSGASSLNQVIVRGRYSLPLVSICKRKHPLWQAVLTPALAGSVLFFNAIQALVLVAVHAHLWRTIGGKHSAIPGSASGPGFNHIPPTQKNKKSQQKNSGYYRTTHENSGDLETEQSTYYRYFHPPAQCAHQFGCTIWNGSEQSGLPYLHRWHKIIHVTLHPSLHSERILHYEHKNRCKGATTNMEPQRLGSPMAKLKGSTWGCSSSYTWRYFTLVVGPRIPTYGG